jgi:hypothetical protein
MPAPNAARETRGSQKLLENLASNGDVPSVDAIKKALNLPTQCKIPNWLIRGTPPAYLTLEGTVECPIAQISDVVASFVKLNDSAINFRIFTNGIPIPDIAQVIVTNTPGEE